MELDTTQHHTQDVPGHPASEQQLRGGAGPGHKALQMPRLTSPKATKGQVAISNLTPNQHLVRCVRFEQQPPMALTYYTHPPRHNMALKKFRIGYQYGLHTMVSVMHICTYCPTSMIQTSIIQHLDDPTTLPWSLHKRIR